MTALAGLWNVAGDQGELDTWSLTHMASHRDILKAIFDQGAISLPEYILDPIPLQDMGTWIYQHQRMHQDMNQVFGISGLNLLNVDWQDPASRAGFVIGNATEHRQIANLLGIG